MNHSLSYFLRNKPLVLPATTGLQDAALAMRRRKVGSIVVTDNSGQVVGMATDRDLVCKGLANSLSRKATLLDVMSTNVVAVEEESNILTVAEAMESRGVRRVPVINAEGHCLGVITLDDLIVAQLIPTETLIRIVRSQVLVKSATQPSHLPGRSENVEIFMTYQSSVGT